MKQRCVESLRLILLLGLLAVSAGPAFADDATKEGDKSTYDQDTVLKDAENFFGRGAEGLAKVIEKAFREYGRPNGYITGEEASGAMGVGLRYGDGTLTLKTGATRKVYWQGPSVGFDWGANASKAFVLVYHLPNEAKLFQRFPAVDGSFYYVGGIKYQRRNNIVLAPIRLGVGLRAGASIGYMHYSKSKTYNPF